MNADKEFIDSQPWNSFIGFNFRPYDSKTQQPPYKAISRNGKLLETLGFKLVFRRCGDSFTLYAFRPGNPEPACQIDCKAGQFDLREAMRHATPARQSPL